MLKTVTWWALFTKHLKQAQTLGHFNTSSIIQTREHWSSCFLSGSLSLGLVADRDGHLSLSVLFLAVDDEEQRRVHSYTSEVKHLPERKCDRKTVSHGWDFLRWQWWNTYLLFMCYTISLDLWFRNDYSVSYQDAPAVRCVVHHHNYAGLLAVYHAKCTAGRQEEQSVNQDFFFYEECGRELVVIRYTHKAMRPSEARLNTTLPRAATPALWPCVREDRVRGSKLPTRPVGERNWGDEHGPNADVLRLESMVRNRRAFTFPWRDGETG